MPSFNRVTLIGHLTRDVQSNQLPSGTTVAEFGMAMNHRYRTKDGEDREEVCFVDCAAFGKQAEIIQQYCGKGKALLVEGRLKLDAWKDKNGEKRSRLSVVVENFRFMGGGESKSGGEYPKNRESFRKREPVESPFEEHSFKEADIPF